MPKLTRFVPVLLGVGLMGCPASSSNSGTFDESSAEVNESWAALSSGDPDSTFGAMDQIGQASQAGDDDADAGIDESGGGGRKRWPDRAHRGPRPHGRGHGIGLLVWYADLDALQVCQDLRTSCLAGEDTSTCGQQVKDCVKPVLQQAFAALCEERIAQCDASGANERGCEQIRSVCGGDAGTGAAESDTAVDEHEAAGRSGDRDRGPRGEHVAGAGAESQQVAGSGG